jgi:hypothetical protein
VVLCARYGRASSWWGGVVATMLAAPGKAPS